MHRLNSILSHEKRSSGLAGKLTVSGLCATDRVTDIQSITLHENQIEATSHHRLPQPGAREHHSDMTNDPENRISEKEREGSGDTTREMCGAGREEKEKESIQRLGGEGMDGESWVPLVSPFGPLMWGVTTWLSEG